MDDLDTIYSVKLNASEMNALYNLHKKRADYWSRCESTQRRLAKTANPNTTELFSDGPCEDEKMTPEGWLKRAAIFKEWKLAHRKRARLFRLRTTVHED